MEGLPFLPGTTFVGPTKNHFHVSQTLNYKNGYMVPKRPDVAVGGMTLPFNRLSEEEIEELAKYTPTLTYGQAKQAPPEDFVPASVAFDKKVLRFYAWMKQTVYESAAEHYRVRPVKIYYYLEDDSLQVVEPRVQNSGLNQGILVNRHRCPKDDAGNTWTWKDLNNGVNVTVYGRVFHIYDCDKFTRDWLESEGIEVKPTEDCPTDPYIDQRSEHETVKNATTPSDFDKLRQFLEMDRKVLRFYCVWDDRDRMFGEMTKFVLHYYLSDDTIELLQVRSNNDGFDPFPVFMKRHRCPKDREDIAANFPRGTMEITDEEVREYFSPVDFGVGKTVVIYGRRFLVYDIDEFTKAFYWKNFGLTDFTPINVEAEKLDPPKAEIPQYNFFGTIDDSMQNLLKVVPVPPKRDYVKYMDNQGKILRYELKLEMPKKEEINRRFVLSYCLSDDMISIHEPTVANSGFVGGKYLGKCRVAKPCSTAETPTYYGPQDFYIGAVVDIFRKRFVVVDADYYVLNYVEEYAHQFPDETLQTLREKLSHKSAFRESLCQPLRKSGPLQLHRTGKPGELECIVEHVKKQLRQLAVTSKTDSHRIFLGLDVGRTGYITKENLRQACIRRHLPCTDDVIDCLASQIGRDPDHVTLDEIRKFLHDD